MRSVYLQETGVNACVAATGSSGVFSAPWYTLAVSGPKTVVIVLDTNSASAVDLQTGISGAFTACGGLR